MNSFTIYRRPCRWALALPIAASMFAGGCGDGSSNQNTNDAAPEVDASPGIDAAGPTGGLRFVHAAPQAGELDIYIKDQTSPLLTNIGYGTTTGLIQAPVGTYQLVIRHARATTTIHDYVSDPVTVTEGGSFTVLGAGVLEDDSTKPTADLAFRTIGLPNTFSTPETGKSHVRVVNAMYSASTGIAVDLQADGTLDVTALAPFAISEPSGFAVAASTDLPFNVQTVSTATPPAPVAIGSFTVPAAMLGDGSDVYVVVSGQNNVPTRDPRGPVAYAVTSDRASTAFRPDPTLFVLNVSPDAGSIDGYLDGQARFPHIDFGAIASTTIRSSTTGFTLDVRAAGSSAGSPPLGAFSTGPLDGGQQYLAVIYGLTNDTTGTSPLSLTVVRNDMVNTTLNQDHTGILRIVNATTGTGPIDGLRFSNATPLVGTPVTDYLAIPVGGASPAQGTPIDTTSLSVNAGMRMSSDPTKMLLFVTAGGMTPLDQWFGVFAGAWLPTGNQAAARFIVVKTASTKDWTTSSFALQPNSIVVSPASANLIVGHGQQYTATALFANGTSRDVTNSVTWTPGTLTIGKQLPNSPPGFITAMGQGTTKITVATSTSPTLRVDSTLNVRAVAAPSVSATQPSDGASGVSTITPVAVTFDRPIVPGSLTARTSAGTCSGGLQLSADNFATCVGFATAAPALNADATVATIALALPLAGVTTYKLRVSNAASADGPAMTTAFVQTTGFVTADAVPGPAVVSTQPADGDQDVDIDSPIAIAFDRAIAPATLTAQTATGACAGSLQLSADGFGTCVGFAAAAPTMSAGDTVATAQPAAALTRGTTYKIRIAGTVTTAAGFPAVTTFTQTTGFATKPPDVPLAVSSTQPADGATAVSTLAPIVVAFNQAISPDSLTTQTEAGPCSGTLQVSADDFATCIGFALASPTLDATSAVATAQPGAALSVQTMYKIRVLGAVTSAQGLPLGADVTQAFGFTTAAQLQISATQPADASTANVLDTAITVTFSEPISPATLTAQTTAGPCTDSLQLSTDGFATCVGFTRASPTMGAGNTTAMFQPAANLSGQTTYQIRVTGTLLSAAGVPLGTAFTQPTRFRTTCAGKLVISQVFGGNNASSSNHFDYIELHNNGRMPVDVKGFVLQLGNPAITTWTAQNLATATFARSSIIPPGGYFLVREALSGTDNSDADAIPSGTPGSLPATTAKVVLTHTTTVFTTCPTTDVVDKVGCGAGNGQCAEGTATAALGTTAAPLSASRNLGGCQDTDSNALDFTIGTPAPRNSTAAVQLCDCPD